MFLSDNGLLLTCGQGDVGCLGHGDAVTLNRPKLIDGLLMVDVATVSCGSSHVVATTADGSAFSWGCGEDGRLGHGDEEGLYVFLVCLLILDPGFTRWGP